MPQGGSEDLTARLIGLRDVLRGEIAAGQALASSRMDGMDSARQQYLSGLAAERDALSDRIQAVRDLAHTENAALEQLLTVHLTHLQEQVNRRLEAVYADRDARFAAIQIQLDQRFAVEAEARQTALETATEAIRAALRAAETAVNKSETSTEKRFEGVNEFRQQLADQTRSFPTRDETAAQLAAVNGITARNTDALKDLELRLTSRLDTAAGRSGGQDDARDRQRDERDLQHGSTQLIIAGVATLIAVISVIVSISVALHKLG